MRAWILGPGGYYEASEGALCSFFNFGFAEI